jgi:transposase-like protein
LVLCCVISPEPLDYCGDWERCGGHSQKRNAQGASKGEVVRHLNTILAHLPPPDTKRWTARRKASVVAAVLSGMITVEEVCQRYGLSVDEFLSWHNAMQRHGLPGLRITKLQNYRYSRPKKD